MKYINKEEFELANMFGQGASNENFSQYFSGESYINPLTDPTKDEVFVANVTFEPGCRNNWHTHVATNFGGQVLICTAGEGWYQQENEAAIELKEGSVQFIPANVKHWHGAKKDSWFSHVTFSPRGENPSTQWHEKVTDEEYNKL